MQQGTDHRKETVDDGWIEQQRLAIEADQQRIAEALELFRRATEALPKLDARLREQETCTKKLQARLESEGASILASLGEAQAGHSRALAGQYHSLMDDARRSMDETRLKLEATFHTLLQRLDATEAALAQDRTAMNQLNRRLAAQTAMIEELTRRLDTLEKEQRIDLGKVSENLACLRQDDASIRGTISQLHGQVSRLTKFISWFAKSESWRRVFGRPPVD